MNWNALHLTLQITLIATSIIAILGLALALLLARKDFPGKTLLDLLIALPLILPPSVLGYYLLGILGRNGPVVRFLHIELLFTWPAAVIAATVVGLPLMVMAARSAIADIDPEIENAARLSGASEWQLLWYITLPMARRGILAGLILASARALGEFGATLMIAGDIPGRTQTMSMAIYDAVQNRQYDQANLMVLIMTSVAFAGLWLAMRWGYGRSKPRPRLRSQSRFPFGRLAVSSRTWKMFIGRSHTPPDFAYANLTHSIDSDMFLSCNPDLYLPPFHPSSLS